MLIYVIKSFIMWSSTSCT